MNRITGNRAYIQASLPLVVVLLFFLISASLNFWRSDVLAASGACPQGPLHQDGGTWETYFCSQFNSLSSSEDVPGVPGNDGTWMTGAACGSGYSISILPEGGNNVLAMSATGNCYGFVWRNDQFGGAPGGDHPQGGTMPLRTADRDGVRIRLRLRPVSSPYNFCTTAGFGVNAAASYWGGSNDEVLAMLGLYGNAGAHPSSWYKQLLGNNQYSGFNCNTLPGYLDVLVTGLESTGGGTPTWTYQISSDGGGSWQTVWNYTGNLNWPRGLSFGDPTYQGYSGNWPAMYVDFAMTEKWTEDALINNSQCMGITAPASVQPGQTFSATISMKNNGATTWDNSPSGYEHKLGSQNPQDNTRWGASRVGLPSPYSFAPNSTVNFTGNFTAPLTPGNYAFDWKMIEEQVQWFGETCATTIAVVTPPETEPPVSTLSCTTDGCGGADCMTADRWDKDGSISLNVSATDNVDLKTINFQRRQRTHSGVWGSWTNMTGYPKTVSGTTYSSAETYTGANGNDYQFQTWAVDAAGNTGETVTSKIIWVDIQLPTSGLSCTADSGNCGVSNQTDYDGLIQLVFSATDNIDLDQVQCQYRSKPIGGVWSAWINLPGCPHTGLSGTSYNSGTVTFTGTNGNVYQFQTQAKDDACHTNSWFTSGEVTVICCPDAPNLTLSSLSPEAGDDIDLSWTNVNCEEGYEAQRKIGGIWTSIANVGVDVTTYSDGDVQSCGAYEYRIGSKKNGCPFDPNFSSPKTIDQIIQPLENLNATLLESSEVEVTWTDKSEIEANYLVERKINSGPWGTPITLPSIPGSGYQGIWVDSSGVCESVANPGDVVTYRVTVENSTLGCSAPETTSISCPLPTCSVYLVPDQLNPYQLHLGETVSLPKAFITIQDGDESDIQVVNFTADRPGVVDVVSPLPPYSLVVNATTTGIGIGSTPIRVEVNLDWGNSCTCDFGNNKCSEFFVLPPDPWFQTKGGDVHAAANINDPIPSSATEPYLSLDGDGGDPGIVSYGTDAVFGDGSVSSRGWLAKAASPGSSYNYFEKLLAKVNFLTPPGVSNIADPGSGNTVFYKFAGDQVYNKTGLDVNGKIVVLVSGNLEINQDININSGGFITFIVGNNIVVQNTVNLLEGIYFSDATLSVEGNDPVFEGKGCFIAGGFSLNRNLADNSATAAEQFSYLPSLWVDSPQELWFSPFQWQELAP